MNQLTIAKHYLEELRQQRTDIVAAALCGSAARDKATAFSDIDLMVLVTGDTGGELIRDGIDGWRAGIYIDAGLQAQKDYQELGAVLSDPIKATEVNEALILYDPTGFFGRLQQAVRTHYREPYWLNKRLTYWLDQARTSLTQFQAGVSHGDVLRVCEGLGWFTFACACVPILQVGQTPSSMKTLQQLEPLAPPLKGYIVALESATPLSAADVFSLEPLLLDAIPMIGTAYGQLPGFYVQKAMWMVQQGQHQAAFHALWLMMAITAGLSAHGDAVLREQGIELMTRWLTALGYAEQASLGAKVQIAEGLFKATEKSVTLAV